VVAGGAYYHVRSPCIREAFEKPARAGGWAGVASLTSAHHRRRLPVIILEKRVDPPLGAGPGAPGWRRLGDRMWHRSLGNSQLPGPQWAVSPLDADHFLLSVTSRFTMLNVAFGSRAAVVDRLVVWPVCRQPPDGIREG
jgi:hypothetical protein